MNCDEFIAFWDSDAAGATEGDARAAVDEHLEQCQSCRRRTEAMDEEDRAMTRLFVPGPAPDGFAAEVLSGWHQNRPARFRLAPTAAALLIVTFLAGAAGVALGRQWRAEPPAAVAPAPAPTVEVLRPEPAPILPVEIVLVQAAPEVMPELLRYLADLEVVLRKVKNRPASIASIRAIGAEVEASRLIDRGRRLQQRFAAGHPRLNELLDGSQVVLLRLLHLDEATYQETYRRIVGDIESQNLINRMVAIQWIEPQASGREEPL